MATKSHVRRLPTCFTQAAIRATPASRVTGAGTSKNRRALSCDAKECFTLLHETTYVIFGGRPSAWPTTRASSFTVYGWSLPTLKTSPYALGRRRSHARLMN